MDQSNPRSLLSALTKLEVMRASRTAPQNRDFKRFVIRGDAECRPVDGFRTEQQKPVFIQLRDVSFGGLGFVCQQPMAVGTFWRVVFINGGYVVGAQTMVVRHCQEVGGSVFLVGGQFCAEAGLLCLLGIQPADLRQASRDDSGDVGQCLPLTEVA